MPGSPAMCSFFKTGVLTPQLGCQSVTGVVHDEALAALHSAGGGEQGTSCRKAGGAAWMPCCSLSFQGVEFRRCLGQG